MARMMPSRPSAAASPADARDSDRSPASHYVRAALIIALAALARSALDPYLHEDQPYVTFLIAVAVIAWTTSTRVTALSIVAGWLAADLLFVPPRGVFVFQGGIFRYLAETTAYFSVTLAMLATAERMRRARTHAESSGARVAEILGSITDAFYVLDSDWRFTFVNDETVLRFGTPRDRIIGRNLWEMFPAAMEGEAHVHLHRAMADRVTVEYEALYEPWQRWFLDKAFPTREGGLAVYTRDITDRKRAEEELRSNDERKSYLVELADTLRPLSDPGEAQAEASRVLGERIGADRVAYFEVRDEGYVVERDYTAGVAPIKGRYPLAAFGADLLAAYRAGRTASEADFEAASSRPPAELEAFAAIQVRAYVGVPLVKGGVFVSGLAVHSAAPREWTSVEIAMIEETAERTWAAVERARGAAALRASEERFRTLFESMDEGYCVAEMEFDAEGRATDYRIIEMNPAFEKHTGQKDLLGRSVRESAPGLEEFWFETYGRVATTGEATRFIHQAGPMDGRWFDVYAFRLGGAGSDKVAILFTDISERRRAEEGIRDALRDTQLLHRLTMDMAAPATPQELYDRLMDAAVEIMNSDFASLQVLHPERGPAGGMGELRLLAHRGFPPEAAAHWEWVTADSGCSCGIALKTGRRCDVADFANDLRINGREREVYIQAGFLAVQTTPLLSRDGRVLGAISTHWKAPRDPGKVDEREWRMLDVLARHAADLLERNGAEERLRRSEERLRLIVESARDYAIFTVDPAGHVTNWNTGAGNLLGYDEAEVVGRPADIVYTPEDRAEGVPGRELAKAREEGRAENERWHVRKDGSRFWASGLVMPMRDDGNLIGFVKVMRDRTDARLAEEKLRRVVQSEMVGILFWRKDGTIVDANDTFLDMLGYGRADLEAGRLNWTDLTPPEYAEADRNALRELDERGSCTPYHKEYVLKDGSRLPILIGGALLRDGADEGVSFVADVTAQRQQEAEREAIRGTLSTLIERCPFGIYIIDADFRIANMNDRTQNGAFVNVRPVIGRHFDEALRVLWPESVAADIARRFRDTLETGGSYYSKDFASPRVDLDQTESYEWELHRITLPDGRPGVVCYYYDSTRLRTIEGALREADVKKNEFLGVLAHELRNPLTPLRNGLQLMKLARDDAPAVEQARAMMERQLGQMVHLIDDLMDLTRISQGKIALKKALLPVAVAVRNAVETSRSLIEQRGHSLTLAVPEEPIFVDGDETRLSQVLANLLNNAAKYTERGGRIRLSVERLGGDVVLSVEDNGVGIPAPMLPKVFDMFTQVDRSREMAQGGLGIGLNIVRRLVEMHGGVIEVHSDGHGSGSRFVVRLPSAPAPAPPDAEPDDARGRPTAAARRRILVVDDNVDSAAMLARMLKLMGNETTTAHDGYQAVDAAEAFRPDLVLLDIGMPRLNGYEAAQRIREQPWGEPMTLVALTGWGQEDDRRRASEAGFDFHLVKPVDPKELEKLLAGPRVEFGSRDAGPAKWPHGPGDS